MVCLAWSRTNACVNQDKFVLAASPRKIAFADNIGPVSVDKLDLPTIPQRRKTAQNQCGTVAAIAAR